MNKIMFWVATVVVALLTYLGAFALLGSTIMYDDWRVFFISALPTLVVIGYASYIYERRGDVK